MSKKTRPELRICHLADVHLGYRRYNRLTKTGFNQREADVNIAFREAIDRIIKLKPSITVIAGDLFHAVRPTNAVLGFCFRELRRLASGTGAPVVVLAGNHESPKRADVGNPLRLFSEIEGVHVADQKAERFVFPELELSVLCLPHTSLLALNELTIRADDRYTYNILALHAQVDERWVSDFGGVDLALQQISPHEWDYIALGHVHLHKAVALNAAYSGSLEHTSANFWAEAQENKGFYEIEFPSAKRTFHALTSPREAVSLPMLDCRGLPPERVDALIQERVEAVPGGIDGKLLRLELRNLPREVFRQVDHRKLRQYRATALNFTLDVRPPENIVTARTLRGGQRGALNAELAEFAMKSKFTNAKAEEVRDLLLSYLQKVEAEDEAVKPQA